MATTHILSGTTSSFITCNNEGRLDQNKKYEAAFLSLDMYNSIPNIDRENNVFEYSIDSGKTWKIITIDTGAYELSDINNEIQRKMVAEGDFNSTDKSYYITITANLSRGTSIVNITNPNYRVRFNDQHSIRQILGFVKEKKEAEEKEEKIEIGFGYNESKNKVDIMPVNSILVHINIISGSFVKGISSPEIHSFYPNVGFGYKIIETPNPELMWYPVTACDLKRIELKLTDQDGKLIDIGGERLTVRICVREIVSIRNEIIQAIKSLKNEYLL